LELVEEGSFGELGAISQHFTMLSAYSFLVFNLLCAPCFAAIGAIKREMNNAKWTWFAVAYQCVFAYVMAFMVFQFGSMFYGTFGVGTIIAFLLLATLLYLLLRPYKKRLSSNAEVNDDLCYQKG
ncbi:MAG: nucleoside recognition domain-containing protein, partial [Anaerovorax sp.]|nr:nucleoside recognition domain-containing protein [Anaerovorax sp.]